MRDPRIARRERAFAREASPGIALRPRASGEIFFRVVDPYERVRQPVAKSRHIGMPALAARFLFSHSSAQARMRSRDARGSVGGGDDVSTGGSGASFVWAGGATGAALGAACGAGGRDGGAPAFGFAAGDAPDAGLPAGLWNAPFVCAFAFRAAVSRAVGAGVSGAGSGAAATPQAPAKQAAAIAANDDEALPAAAIFSFLRERNGRAICL